MALNLPELPIYRGTQAQADEARQKVWDACTRDGYAAFKTGARLKDCPPFVDPDMAVSWRMGWRRGLESKKD